MNTRPCKHFEPLQEPFRIKAHGVQLRGGQSTQDTLQIGTGGPHLIRINTDCAEICFWKKFGTPTGKGNVIQRYIGLCRDRRRISQRPRFRLPRRKPLARILSGPLMEVPNSSTVANRNCRESALMRWHSVRRYLPRRMCITPAPATHILVVAPQSLLCCCHNAKQCSSTQCLDFVPEEIPPTTV